MNPPPNFDRVARLYRWFEYAALGPLLTLARNHYLPALAGCKQALILGDGDGRFTARLLAAHPHLQAHAVDLSRAMLRLLKARARAGTRLYTHHANALTFTPTTSPDLVVTHFFIDCLTQPQLNSLIAHLAPALAPQALWLVSEFRIPQGFLKHPTRVYIRLLYLAFRILTGLRVTHLPDHATPLCAAGFTRIATHHRLFGILTTELWQR